MASVRETLDKLEKELLSSVSRLRAELAPLERELADVRKAKAALPAPSGVDLLMSFTESVNAAKKAIDPYSKLTMKELTLRALREQFPLGATANELVEFFHNAWGRKDVVRSSLSPQLSRLKEEGFIDREGYNWFLLEPKKQEAPEPDISGGAP